MVGDWLMFAVVGAIAGLFAGLLGIGGGLIIVPALIWIFAHQGLPEMVTTHLAIGTSLLTIVVTALASVRAHHLQQTVNWQIFRLLVMPLALGSLIGAYTAVQIDSTKLQLIIGLFVWLMAVRLWLPLPNKLGVPSLIQHPAVSGYGLFAGGVSAMVGIGGGTLIVPYLVLAGESIKRAIGTAASCGLPIAIFGAMGFIWLGQDLKFTHPWVLGYVHLQAFLGIIATSVLFAPIGARLAKRTSPRLLKSVFSVLLMLVGTYLVLK